MATFWTYGSSFNLQTYFDGTRLLLDSVSPAPEGDRGFSIQSSHGTTYSFSGEGLTYDEAGFPVEGFIDTLYERQGEDQRFYVFFLAEGFQHSLAPLPVSDLMALMSGPDELDMEGFTELILREDDFVDGTGGDDTLMSLGGDDWLRGLGGDDLLFGGRGNDWLMGFGGDDYLAGGTGADTLAGYDGNDRYFVQDAGDIVQEWSGPEGGIDRILATVSFSLGDGQEHLIFSGDRNARGTGNSLDNEIGGNRGANRIFAADGDDTLHGYGDDDTLIGGEGNDLIIGFGSLTPGSGESLTPLAEYYLGAHANSLVSGLGGSVGFGEDENVLPADDDNFSGVIDITPVFGSAGINFFGTRYTSLYVNNNGSVSFGSGLEDWTPSDISESVLPIIAPFWADVDTRGGAIAPTPGGSSQGTNRVYWDLDANNHVLTVTWDDVDYYHALTAGHVDKANAFQLQLIGQENGDFYIVFRYEAINWTTGDDGGGVNGLGGIGARAGYSAGDLAHYFELPQSGDQAAMLALDSKQGNLFRKGTYIFDVENGVPQSLDDGSDDFLRGDAGADTLRGGKGDDTLDGGVGHDVLTGGPGNDKFVFSRVGTLNVDRISDFKPYQDDIVLDSRFFRSLDGPLVTNELLRGANVDVSGARQPFHRLLYDTDSGNLYYDRDGSGPADEQLIAVLVGNPDQVNYTNFHIV